MDKLLKCVTPMRHALAISRGMEAVVQPLRTFSISNPRSGSLGRLEKMKLREAITHTDTKKMVKFDVVPGMPQQLKSMVLERSDVLLRDVEKDLVVSTIFTPAVMEDLGENIDKLLADLAKKGDEDAKQMRRVFMGIVKGEITHAHLLDSVPPLNLDDYNIDPATLKSNPFIVRRVGIDNAFTSRTETIKAIIEHTPQFLFAFALMHRMGFGYPNTVEKPFFCFRTVHNQAPHRDSVASEQSKMLALHGISATGEVKTFVVDLDLILRFLDPEEIKFLSQPIFHLRSDTDSNAATASNLFPILTQDKIGRWSINFDSKPGTMSLSSDKAEDYFRLEYIAQKISYIVSELVSQGKAHNIGIKTGKGLFIRNEKTLHGRVDFELTKEERESGASLFDSIYEGQALQSFNDYLPMLEDKSGEERRVARLLSGASKGDARVASEFMSQLEREHILRQLVEERNKQTKMPSSSPAKAEDKERQATVIKGKDAQKASDETYKY